MAKIWAGIDAGKTHHHCVAIDESGRRLLSRRFANDEPELLELLADVLSLGDEVTWIIDLADCGAALAVTMLFHHAQPVHYVSGRAIHRASESYRGEGKTDARDAAVIADQVRIRRDLNALRTGDETVTGLRILVGRRTDLEVGIAAGTVHRPMPAGRWFLWTLGRPGRWTSRPRARAKQPAPPPDMEVPAAI